MGTPNDSLNLEEEVLKMQYFKHPNVMSLIGVCENFCGGPAVVMPFMANGNLLDYLRRERKNLVLDAEAEKSMVCTCICSLTAWTLCRFRTASNEMLGRAWERG